jgi:CheY-like chemotaxis protein
MIGDAPLLSPRKVLIVEDNALNLKLLYDILEHLGYSLLTTERGEDAVGIAGAPTGLDPDGYSAARYYRY